MIFADTQEEAGLTPFSIGVSVPHHCWSLRICPSVKAAVHKLILPAQRVEYLIWSVLYFDIAKQYILLYWN